MPANITYEWTPRAITATAMRHTERLAERKAAEVVAVADPPVDTGFLKASGYVNSSSGYSTFERRRDDGYYTSRRTGKLVKRTGVAAPEAPPEHGAIAGWSAAYTIYVEERTGFIYRALLIVGSRK